MNDKCDFHKSTEIEWAKKFIYNLYAVYPLQRELF